jgi:FkbM family methyltransferase
MNPYIKRLLWAVSRNKRGIARHFYSLANQYCDAYRDFSYEFRDNGELLVLNGLAKAKIQTIFDVGANVGDWSKIAAGVFPESDIHAFELSPATFQTLGKSLDGKRFHLNNFGLGSYDGEIEFKDFGENSGSNSIITDLSFHDSHTPSSIKKSRIVRGESYCQQHGIKAIDFLKIDVEGAEHLVLEGFKGMLGEKAIRCVQFEYGYANGDAKYLMKDFFAFFESFDYSVGKVCSAGARFGPFDYTLNDFHSGPNFVAVRRSDGQLLRLLEQGPK